MTRENQYGPKEDTKRTNERIVKSVLGQYSIQMDEEALVKAWPGYSGGVPGGREFGWPEYLYNAKNVHQLWQLVRKTIQDFHTSRIPGIEKHIQVLQQINKTIIQYLKSNKRR